MVEQCIRWSARRIYRGEKPSVVLLDARVVGRKKTNEKVKVRSRVANEGLARISEIKEC